jgi:rhomboid family protein
VSDYYRPGGFGGFRFFPPVIKNLLIINGVVFLIQLLSQNVTFGGIPGDEFLIRWFALMPLSSGFFEIWQLITYQFMHGGFMHILFNMFVLWMFGMEVENLWGSKKFLFFYLLCGVAAGISQLFLTPLLTGEVGPTIGASGAIYGVLIAFGLLFPNRYIFLYFFIPIKAKYLITFMILLEFFAISPQSNIAHLAHLGGALAGFIYLMLDKDINFDLKNYLRRSSFSGSSSSRPFNPFGNLGEKFKKKESDVQEAKFYDLDKTKESSNVTQEEIDRILDKISRSGYQNLTQDEKRKLFEASKKMK